MMGRWLVLACGVAFAHGALHEQIEALGKSIALAPRNPVLYVKRGELHRMHQEWMAAALGLTPRQHSSGGKERLLGISKRGDAYLRTLLIHGARSVIRTAKGKEDRLSRWVVALAARSHPNVAAAALANKTARMAWAMMRNGTDYQPDLVTD